MTKTARLRAVTVVVAVVVSLVGAVIYSRTVADDDVVDAVLDTPGEYVEPGVSTNPPLSIERLPPVRLRAADGSSLQLVSDGRPMVVNLWYSTCPPCARELVDFAEVEGEVGELVRFVGVNPRDDAETMGAFAADRGVRYELLRDPTAALADELDLVAFPVTLFVNRDGRVLERTGSLDADELRERLVTYWGIGH